MGSPSNTSFDIAELIRHPLHELGVQDAAGISDLFQRIHRALENDCENPKSWEELRIKWLGRKQGFVSSIADNWLKTVPAPLKRDVGQHLNALRQEAEQRLTLGPDWKKATEDVAQALTPSLDITLPGARRAVGVRHPLRRALDEITEIFFSLGYSVEDGPEIESVYYNFEALNIPEDHPSRDDQDTFYIDSQTVLRTHTSPVQVRTMEKQQPPLRIIVLGKVYRNETPDAGHACMFHQVEGLAVDTNITFADLKGTLNYFMKAYFGPAVRTRFRPSFFPFTEPSAEMDVSCILCGGEGCRVCKGTGWLELGGCGMVDPAVFAYVRYDAARFSGFAFGFGVERLAMLKYGIHDIQLFLQSDIRFLHQFR